jgi:alpha-glucuronidase
LIDRNGFEKKLLMTEIRPRIYMANLPKLKVKMFFTEDNLEEFIETPIVKERVFDLDTKNSNFKQRILIYKEIIET